MSGETCILCSSVICDDTPFVALTEKGMTGIINASKQRDDKIHEFFNPIPTDAVKVHTECRRVYVNPIKIKSDLKLKSSKEDIASTSSRPLRGSVGSFNFKENCLFCGHSITDYEIRKKMTIIPVRTIQIRDTILKICSSRSDIWATNVHARMLSVIDLPAADARYHQVCSVNFRSGKSIPIKYASEASSPSPTLTGRKVNTDSSDAFVKTCDWLQDNYQEPISVSDLVEKMRSFLPEGSEPYTSRHLKKKLQEKFGDNVIISGTEGKCNMITFGKTVSNIISDYHKQKQIDDPDKEKFRLIESAAKLIRTEINLLFKSKECYPSASEIASVEENKTYIPPILLNFLNILIGGKCNDLKLVSIGQAVMQACRPRSLICPIPLAVGIQIHRDFGSRFLIDELFNLGFSVSYDEVQKYIHSSVMNENNQSIVPSGHFSQWVADNVDHNLATIDGHNTFHGMGIIMCSTGASSNTSLLLTDKIKRLKFRPLANEIIKKAKIPLHYIQSPSSTAVNKLAFQNLFYEPIQSNLLDVLWSTSKLFKTPQPGWLGYMQTAVEGEHCGLTVTSFLPMIDLNPTSHSCVYTTLMFISNEARRMNVKTPIVTFDQCLWIKAMEIKCSNQKGEFDNVVIRLGGFHTLMSFLGAIGGLMAGSGIEEALQTVYAENSVPHMLKGKAYSRALRGHLLLSSALTALIIADVLKCSLPFEVSEDSNLSENESEIDCMTNDLMELETSEDLNIEQFILLFENVRNGDTKAIEVNTNHHLQKLSTLIDERKNHLKSQSRTAKLWLMYLNMMDIVKTFISAERSGNFEMHLQAVEHMLPFFASSGHNNYAKCARIYLHQMHELKTSNPEVYKMLETGHFTVRRQDRKWSGVWTDMHIEQTLMKSTKSRSGMTRGGGMTESQRATWILSHSNCSEIICAVSLLTGVARIGSEQHVDLSDSRMARDFEDIKKIIQFLISHNPFTSSASSLWNIFNGITDSENKVTVENAETIGRNIQNKLTGKLFKDVTLSKSDQAVTMQVLKKGIVIAGETHHVDSRLLTQRMLSCVSIDNNAKDARDFFNYELSTIPTSLFDHGTQQMRKTDKSSLASTLDSMNVNEMQGFCSRQNSYYVLDGGALIHQLPWTASATFGEVIMQYELYVNRKFGKVTIVFDGYDKPNIKDMEHKLRMKQTSVVVVFDENSPVIINKNKFLSNIKNKQNFINMLGSYFQRNGHSVIHAEGDADTLIVKEALNIACERHVTVVADDTDILILLLHHSSRSILMQSFTQAEKVRDIQAMQRSIGEEACKTLPFIHALTGCDTTSALFGKSKSSAFKNTIKSKILCELASNFGSPEDDNKEYLIEIGSKLIVSLYGGNIEKTSLNVLRYEQFTKKIASAKKEFDIARLPPTQNAAKYHLLRVHLQVYIWKNLNLPSPDPTLWGWQLVNGEFQPTYTDLSPAPDTLLNMIKCSCQTTVGEPCHTMNCTCRRYGLPCSIVCKNCSGKNCTNSGDSVDLVEDQDERLF